MIAANLEEDDLEEEEQEEEMPQVRRWSGAAPGAQVTSWWRRRAVAGFKSATKMVANATYFLHGATEKNLRSHRCN